MILIVYYEIEVKNTGDISLNPREPHYCSLQILDFKMFLSEVVLDFVIANKTITDIELDEDSSNPVSNKTVTIALKGKEDAFDFVERMDSVIRDLIDNGE